MHRLYSFLYIIALCFGLSLAGHAQVYTGSDAVSGAHPVSKEAPKPPDPIDPPDPPDPTDPP